MFIKSLCILKFMWIFWLLLIDKMLLGSIFRIVVVMCSVSFLCLEIDLLLEVVELLLIFIVELSEVLLGKVGFICCGMLKRLGMLRFCDVLCEWLEEFDI